MKLSKNEILEYQQNRDPYLMIDYVDELVPGKSVKGFKILKEDEWFLKYIGKTIQICQGCFK